MPLPKIVAPAGGPEQLQAAVRCGADCVYLGTGPFNARRNAVNFTQEQLVQAVRGCHIRNVRVYVTVNTLVTDQEFPPLEQTAESIACAGADGVILQDMGAVQLFSRRYPSLRRIASTQTAVHNTDGARFLQDAGFQSFVLARELTLEEMAKICAAVPLSAEAFVHGALCMSLSGACYLSSLLGGRSGNRGLCAQPCRLEWHCGRSDHALSLRDMSLLDYIPALAQAGVAELKIEGRMKRPEYVAAAVTACRLAREGRPYDRETLSAVFSRHGFTDGYLTGRRDQTMYGFRTQEDALAGQDVLPRLQALYQKETPSVPVDMAFSLTQSGSSLTVTDGDHTLTVPGPPPRQALHRPLEEDQVRRHLGSTGGTAYTLQDLSCTLAPGQVLSAAELNGMRRHALALLDDLRGTASPVERGLWTAPEAVPRPHAHPSPLWARFVRPGQIACPDKLQRILLPTSQITPEVLDKLGTKLTAVLPPVLFPEGEEALDNRLTALKKAGLAEVWADNLYGLTLARRLDLPVRGGFGLNVTNLAAMEFFRSWDLLSLTISFELPMALIQSMDSSLPWGITAYGRLPLMQFRNCPVRAHLGCRRCGGNGTLTDRKGIHFPVECSDRRSACLLNSVPLDMAGREDPGDFRLLWFTRESTRECGEVIDRFLRQLPTPGPHTRGLYCRKLL